MSAYLILTATPNPNVEENIKQDYRTVAEAAIARHGGNVIVRSPSVIVLTGAVARMIMVVMFADPNAALAFWNDPQYVKAAPQRQQIFDQLSMYIVS